MGTQNQTRREWLETAATFGAVTAWSLPQAAIRGAEQTDATIASDADAKSVAPELIVDVDVNDEVWLRDHAMTEATSMPSWRD